ncbi:MAG TPA: helicase-exonuclease AddAB subunit AddB, partial [Firmicutes bacterium]|nr:helicase-exonuclease AddAB subunit AddB [Bacillota bacterium]
MAFRLIIGRAGSGKTHLCMQEIREELKISPKGPSLIYITPEQATFEAEYDLLSSGIKGSIRGQVLSFRRLAFKVMQEAGGDRRIYIDDVGMAMVARKILERCRASLKTARISSRQEGIVERVVEAYNELKTSRVSLEQLQAVAGSKILSPHLKQKIADLSLIMEQIRSELAADYLDAEECLDLLAAGVSRSAFLKDSRIWLDGFHSFTNQELAVIKELLKYTAEVTVTLCVDRDYNPDEPLNELNPFYPPARSLI